MDIGTKLKALRKNKGITQKVIADYLGIKVNSYSQYENNVRTPSIDILIKVSGFYNVLGTYFFRDENSDSNIEYIKILLDDYFRLISVSTNLLDELKSMEMMENDEIVNDFNHLLSDLMECYFEINEVKYKIEQESSYVEIKKLIEMHF